GQKRVKTGIAAAAGIPCDDRAGTPMLYTGVENEAPSLAALDSDRMFREHRIGVGNGYRRSHEHGVGMSGQANTPIREIRLAPTDVVMERKPDGTIYVRSKLELGPYPRRMTDRLDYWAEHTPDRT